MRLPTKAIILSLLLVLLQAQSASNQYTINGQTYQYIYGSGHQPVTNAGDRSNTSPTSFVPDSGYTPPHTSTPSYVNCPINQVYNNILCECVCILGYYMSSKQCVKFNPHNPVCGKN